MSEEREPAFFSLDDPRIEADAEAELPAPVEQVVAAPIPMERGRRWGSIFLSAVGGLIVLGLLLWVQNTIVSLLARNDWIGWAATALFIVAGVAFAMILLREALALSRLSAIASLRKTAEMALHNGNARDAKNAASEIQGLFSARQESREGLLRLKQHKRDILDARQILSLTERELLLPLDRAARSAIGASARRISVMTSISPAAFLVVGFVAYENLKLLRTLSGIYGGRPGFLSLLRLLRMIAGYLAVTGSIALTDDFVQQLVGHGLTARLSRRLGEGLVNGGFTIRIGLAAVDVLRPLPYIETKRPRVREFLNEFLRFGSGADASQPNTKR